MYLRIKLLNGVIERIILHLVVVRLLQRGGGAVLVYFRRGRHQGSDATLDLYVAFLYHFAGGSQNVQIIVIILRCLHFFQVQLQLLGVQQGRVRARALLSALHDRLLRQIHALDNIQVESDGLVHY